MQRKLQAKASGEGNQVRFNVGVISCRRSNGVEDHIGVLEKILLEEKIWSDQVFVLGFVFGFIHGFLGLGSGEWDCKNSNLEKVKKGKEEQESEVSDQFLK